MKAPQHKPGVLCIINYSADSGGELDDNGKVVKLVRLIGRNDNFLLNTIHMGVIDCTVYTDSDLPRWEVVAEGASHLHVSADTPYCCTNNVIRQQYLIPLGDSDLVKDEKEEELKETARQKLKILHYGENYSTTNPFRRTKETL